MKNENLPESKLSLREARRKEFEYCRDDIIYFASHYCYFEDRDAKGTIVKFEPWEEQKDALISIRDNRLSLFLKARQVGITWVALIYCAWDMIYNPGHSILALSKTKPDANELVRRLGLIFSHMKSFLSGGGIEVKTTKESVILYSKGAPAVFKSLPASPSSGRSFTANVVVIDEWAFQQYAREIWTAAYPTVNRPTGGKVIGISTIKRGTLFEELWSAKDGWHKKFISVFADPRRTKEWYERTKKDLGELIKQEYPRSAEEALANTGGQFFCEFDVTKHVIYPFEIPGDWEIYSAMDYGLDMLAHYKIAVDPNENVYVFHEIYKSGLVISDAAKEIRNSDVSGKGAWHLPKIRLAPPDLFSREASNGKSQVALFSENGIALTRSSNDRRAGWISVKELLKDVTAPDGSLSPRLKIFSTCPNLIRCMQKILIDEKDPNDCARNPHEYTHAPDALRYFAVYYHKKSGNEFLKTPAFERQDMIDDYLRAGEREKKEMLKKWRPCER